MARAHILLLTLHKMQVRFALLYSLHVGAGEEIWGIAAHHGLRKIRATSPLECTLFRHPMLTRSNPLDLCGTASVLDGNAQNRCYTYLDCSQITFQNWCYELSHCWFRLCRTGRRSLFRRARKPGCS